MMHLCMCGEVYIVPFAHVLRSDKVVRGGGGGTSENVGGPFLSFPFCSATPGEKLYHNGFVTCKLFPNSPFWIILCSCLET